MGVMDTVKSSFKEAMQENMSKKITLELAAGYKNTKGKEVTIMQGSGPRTYKYKTTGLMGTTVEY